MSARSRRPIRALFQKSLICDRCQDPTQVAIQCACLAIYCDGCLSAVIHEWVFLKSPDQVPGVDETDLPPSVVSNLRFREITTRVRECGVCFRRTLCPPCAISGYFQRCCVCCYPPHTGVCPRCVNAGALIAVSCEPAKVNAFSPLPKVIWRCPAHRDL